MTFFVMHIQYSTLHELQVHINDERSWGFTNPCLPLGEFKEFDDELIQQDAWQKLSHGKHSFVDLDILTFETYTSDMHTVAIQQVQAMNEIMSKTVQLGQSRSTSYHEETNEVTFPIGFEDSVQEKEFEKQGVQTLEFIIPYKFNYAFIDTGIFLPSLLFPMEKRKG